MDNIPMCARKFFYFFQFEVIMSQCRECYYSNLRNGNTGTFRDIPYECLYNVDKIRYVFGDDSCCHYEDKMFNKGDNSPVCRRCLILGGENCDECER